MTTRNVQKVKRGVEGPSRVGKWTIEEIIEYIKLQGEQIADPEFNYVSCKDKIPIKCGNDDCSKIYNVTWEIYYHSGSRCPYCVKNAKWSTEDIKSFINAEGDTISEDFDYKAGIKIEIKCKYGHNFSMLWINYTKGHRCPQCATNKRASSRKLSIEKIRERVAEIGDELVSDEYVNNRTNLEIKCKRITTDGKECGNVYLRSFMDITRAKPRRCPKCAITSRKIHNMLSKEKVDEYSQTQNLTILGKYDNMHADSLFQCNKCKYKFTTTLDSIKNKSTSCPKCSSSAGERIILEILQKYIDAGKIADITIEYKTDEQEIMKKKRFDFMFHKDGIRHFIEFDGIQHFKPVCFGNYTKERASENLKECFDRDIVKTEYCVNKGLPLLRISYENIKNIGTYIEKFLDRDSFDFRILYFAGNYDLMIEKLKENCDILFDDNIIKL